MLSKYFLNYIKKRATSVPAVSLRYFSFLYKIEYIYLLVNKQIVLHVHVVMVIRFTWRRILLVPTPSLHVEQTPMNVLTYSKLTLEMLLKEFYFPLEVSFLPEKSLDCRSIWHFLYASYNISYMLTQSVV